MGRTAEVLTERSQLVALRPAWDRLILESDPPSVYSTYPYAMTSWAHFDAHHSEPCVITISDDGELIGLALLRRRRRRVGLAWECVLEDLGISQGDRMSFLARAGREDEVWDDALDVVDGLDWDRWALSEIPTSSTGHAKLVGRYGPSDRHELIVEEENEALLTDISGTWEEFYSSHKRMRRNLRALEKAMPDYTVERYVSAETIGAGLELAEALAAQTWKKGKVGLLKSDATRDFYRLVLPKLVTDGFSGIRVLRNGDDVIASQIGLMCGDWVHFHATDYHPDFESYSPGMMMVALTIKDFFESPATTVDYLVGFAGYMSSWATGKVSTEQLTVVREGSGLAGGYRRLNEGLMSARERIAARRSSS